MRNAQAVYLIYYKEYIPLQSWMLTLAKNHKVPYINATNRCAYCNSFLLTINHIHNNSKKLTFNILQNKKNVLNLRFVRATVCSTQLRY